MGIFTVIVLVKGYASEFQGFDKFLRYDLICCGFILVLLYLYALYNLVTLFPVFGVFCLDGSALSWRILVRKKQICCGLRNSFAVPLRALPYS